MPASSNYNQPVIPDFLQNRPNGFVVACLTNITQAERMQYTDVFAMDFTTNTYKVSIIINAIIKHIMSVVGLTLFVICVIRIVFRLLGTEYNQYVHDIHGDNRSI